MYQGTLFTRGLLYFKSTLGFFYCKRTDFRGSSSTREVRFILHKLFFLSFLCIGNKKNPSSPKLSPLTTLPIPPLCTPKLMLPSRSTLLSSPPPHPCLSDIVPEILEFNFYFIKTKSPHFIAPSSHLCKEASGGKCTSHTGRGGGFPNIPRNGCNTEWLGVHPRCTGYCKVHCSREELCISSQLIFQVFFFLNFFLWVQGGLIG